MAKYSRALRSEGCAAMDKGKRPILEEEEEEEPIQITDTKEDYDETTSLCLLGKLWTDRPYNRYALMETMKKLWNPAKGLICRDMGANLISFQFHSKRDMDRVLEMAPWQFNKHILVLNLISREVQPSLMCFNRTPFWIRIYDVPMAGRNESALSQIGNRFGEVIEIDRSTLSGVARSIRMRISMDISKQLKRGTKLRIGTAEPCWLPVTYERLPSFCYWCGLLGHTTRDCEVLPECNDTSEQMQQAQMPFGEFLKASPMKLMQSKVERTIDTHGVHRRELFDNKSYEKTLRNQIEQLQVEMRKL